MPDLSDNQIRLLLAIRRSSNAELTTRELGAVKDANRQPIGADAARKVMGRLQKRSMVDGAGAGGQRKWWMTASGLEAINALRPPAETEGSPQRPYFVFEEMTLAELIERARGAEDTTKVYVKVATIPARNTRHVYQQASDFYEGSSDEPTLVGVADRMFQPKKVPLERRSGAPVPA